MPINKRNIVQQPDITVDQGFDLPPGIVDLRPTPAEQMSVDDEQDSLGEIDDSGSTVIAPADPTGLQPPDSVTLVSQTVRNVPGGGKVVDLVFDIDAPAGVTGYEVRVARA